MKLFTTLSAVTLLVTSAAIAAKNLDGTVAPYAPDAQFLAPNADPAKGEALRKAWGDTLQLQRAKAACREKRRSCAEQHPVALGPQFLVLWTGYDQRSLESSEFRNER